MSVRVRVVDVNEFSPVFASSMVVVSADEGRLYDQLVQLRATDEDCSPKYGDICRYELRSEDQVRFWAEEGLFRGYS